MTNVRMEFLGVMGSVPVGDCKSFKHGGDTLSIAVEYKNEIFFLEAGTGIRKAGRFKEKARVANNPIHIFMSHLHMDHYMGLPFCPLLYDKKLKFMVVGPDLDGFKFTEKLDIALSPPYFPMVISDFENVEYKSLDENEFNINKIKVSTIKLNHPGGAFGYKFVFYDEDSKKTLVHISDNEPSDNNKVSDNLINWIGNADVVIHDAQYTPDEYKKHIEWGHSPFTYPIDIAKSAGAKKLILNHHNPLRDDDGWKGYCKFAKEYANEKNVDTEIAIADLVLEF